MAAIEVPRIDRVVPADVFKVAIMYSVQKLGYDKPSEEQEKAVSKFLRGQDVFISLPTGAGKSLCYACLTLSFDYLRHYGKQFSAEIHHSIAVVSPLSSLIKDQVESFTKRYVCVCVRACVHMRACVHVCVCVCAGESSGT